MDLLNLTGEFVSGCNVVVYIFFMAESMGTAWYLVLLTIVSYYSAFSEYSLVGLVSICWIKSLFRSEIIF